MSISGCRIATNGDMIAWHERPRNQVLVQTWRIVGDEKCLVDSYVMPACPTCGGNVRNHVRGCNSRRWRREYSGE